jgi:DNA-binding NarL/FixJ family response regulator
MNISLVVSVISALFCVFVFFYIKWYIKRRTTAEQLLAEYRNEVSKLCADINFYTDRDSQLIEERINKLKNILEDTDRRIAVYVRELDRSKNNEALYASLSRGIRSALGSPVPASSTQNEPSEPAPPVKRARSREKAEAEPPVPAKKTGSLRPFPEPSASDVAETEARPNAGPEQSKQQIREQIASLAALGSSNSEIASSLGISLSEVDLALRLLGRWN